MEYSNQSRLYYYCEFEQWTDRFERSRYAYFNAFQLRQLHHVISIDFINKSSLCMQNCNAIDLTYILYPRGVPVFGMPKSFSIFTLDARALCVYVFWVFCAYFSELTYVTYFSLPIRTTYSYLPIII